MARNLLADNVEIDFSFVVYLSAIILLIPLRLASAWLIAVIVHEASHYVALRFYGVKVYRIRLTLYGAIMDTESVTKAQEIICALAGPMGALSLVFFRRWLPCTAICASLQSAYNLLPLFSLDGGRALRCIMLKTFGISTGLRLSITIHYITIILMCLFLVHFAIKLDLNILIPTFAMCGVFVSTKRKLPCKPGKLIVQ